MTRLSVNVNKVALLRNSREGEVPNVVKLSRLALEAGAQGITVHPRPDQRHIRPDDVDAIAALLDEPAYRESAAEFNIEGNPFLGEYMAHAQRVRPTQCTLVPDDPSQATSDHGWDVAANAKRLSEVIAQLHDCGARVSLFMDPDPAQIERAAATGAERIELYTKPYADVYPQGGASLQQVFERFRDAAAHARTCGLAVNAGHDLNLDNLGRFATIPGIAEVSIGHALIADALEFGMAETVRAYRRCLESANGE